MIIIIAITKITINKILLFSKLNSLSDNKNVFCYKVFLTKLFIN